MRKKKPFLKQTTPHERAIHALDEMLCMTSELFNQLNGEEGRTSFCEEFSAKQEVILAMSTIGQYHAKHPDFPISITVMCHLGKCPFCNVSKRKRPGATNG
jgi:hypothetical protein